MHTPGSSSIHVFAFLLLCGGTAYANQGDSAFNGTWECNANTPVGLVQQIITFIPTGVFFQRSTISSTMPWGEQSVVNGTMQGSWKQNGNIAYLNITKNMSCGSLNGCKSAPPSTGQIGMRNGSLISPFGVACVRSNGAADGGEYGSVPSYGAPSFSHGRSVYEIQHDIDSNQKIIDECNFLNSQTRPNITVTTECPSLVGKAQARIMQLQQELNNAR